MFGVTAIAKKNLLAFHLPPLYFWEMNKTTEPVSVSYNEAEEQLVMAVKEWLATSQDIDMSLGISLSRSTLARNPAFSHLPTTNSLESLGLLRACGPMFKLSPRVVRSLRGEKVEPQSRSHSVSTTESRPTAVPLVGRAGKRARGSSMPMVPGYSTALSAAPQLINTS